jgi:hypothetical protein
MLIVSFIVCCIFVLTTILLCGYVAGTTQDLTDYLVVIGVLAVFAFIGTSIGLAIF